MNKKGWEIYMSFALFFYAAWDTIDFLIIEMKTKNIDICGFSIHEDLYHLITKYSDSVEFEKNPSKETLEKLIDSGISNSKRVIPELYDETREYPPFLYYIILSYIQIKQPYSKDVENENEGGEGRNCKFLLYLA